VRELGADVRELERRRLGALVAADASIADELHADDYELVSPGGDRWTKAEYLGGIADGSLDYHVFEPESDIRVLDLGTAAALRYVARIEIHSSSGLMDAGRFLHTDIWWQRDGRWQAVWSQATRITED